jgi:hypothetical protein
MNAEFEARRNRLQQRHGNPRYGAGWRQSRARGDDGEDKEQEARAAVTRHLEVLTDPYQDEDYPDVKLMPLWHGTQRDKLGSLLSAGYGAFGDTDDGYFGKGIYATFHAAYAQIYADKFGPVDLENGILIFNWGLTYNSRPIISSDYDDNLRRLTWAPDTARYDSHFVLVVPHPVKKGDYVPITPPEQHKFTEVVFFDTSQILPRYLVTLQPTLPNSPKYEVHTSQISAALEAVRARRKGMMEAEAKSGGMDAQVQQLTATNKELAATNDTQAQRLAATNRQLAVLEERAVAGKAAAVTVAAELAAAVNRAKAAEQATATAVRRAEDAQQAQQLAATNRERELASTHDALVQQLVAMNDAQAQQLAEALRRAEAAERAIAARDLAAQEEELKAATVVRAPAVPIPPVARGFEAIYQRFLNGVLIYRPKPDNDAGMIKLPIAALRNPLESTFDLSKCGDIGQYLSISTGYRKRVNPANANKVEIWIAPRFLIDAGLKGDAKHFQAIAGSWAPDAPVGIFWTWGGTNNLNDYVHLVTMNMENLSKNNLYENFASGDDAHDDPDQTSSVGVRRAVPCAKISIFW